MTENATRVILLGGTGRSGSTLVANALGSAACAFSAGEVRFAWQRGLAEPGLCGCGETVRQCGVWQEILVAAFGSVPSETEALAFHRRLTSATRLRRLPSMLQKRNDPELIDLAITVGRLHAAIAQVSGASVVIDSSKLPTYAALLTRAPNLDLRLVHLVRDPRATAWSWQRTSATGAVEGKDEEMDQFSAWKSAGLWTVWNWALPRLVADRAAYRVLRYEDLMTDPAEAFRDILDFAGMPHEALSVAADHSMVIAPAHTVAGNPNRHRSGDVAFRSDDEWADRLSGSDRVTVDVISRPIRARFGYG